MRQYYFIIFVLCSTRAMCATITENDEFLCQIFDKSAHSFDYYCRDFIKYRTKDVETETYVYMGGCSFHRDSMVEFLSSSPSSQVDHLKVGGCANKTVRDLVAYFNTTLRTLDVSFSGYETINSLNFAQHQLEILNLSHNQIVEHPWNNILEFFTRFPMLQELDLSYNKLNAVHLIANQSIINLERLHLQHNAIAYVQSGAFANLTRLKYIDLSHNQLDSISAAAFSNSRTLQTLHIEQNPIDHFFCDDLLNEKAIDFMVHISWDHVEYFNTDCVGIAPPQSLWIETQYFIALNTGKHGFIPFAIGQYAIHCDIASFRRIRTFIAGRNKYAAVLAILPCFGTTLLELDLSSNFIGYLEPSTFERFHHLYDLQLRDTRLLSFDFQMLQQQQHLIALDISENDLTNINNILLAWNLRDFQEFSAAGNRFKADLLRQLPSTIKYLDLSGTTLGELTLKSFQYLTALEELRLRKTVLKFSNGNPFEGLANLQLLDISQNDLNGMDFTRIATTLAKLREFRAAECNLSKPVDLIEIFGLNLWTLDLSGNFIGDVHKNSPFHRLNLLHLFLNHANISSFDLETLRESSNLAYFEIANNSLREIDLKPLAGDYLIELNISGNKLNTIKHLTPINFPKLRFLNVEHNQLSCKTLTQLTDDWTDKLVDFEHLQMSRVNCTQMNEDDVV